MADKKPPQHGAATEGAGRQSVDSALNGAENPNTQTSLKEFQDAISDDVDEAKSDVDSEQWEEVAERAEEAETEYEEAVDSRADKYSDEGWEAVPEEDRQGTVDESEGETTGDRFADDRDDIVRRDDPSIAGREQDRIESEDLEETALANQLDEEHPLNAEVHVTINDDARLPDDASAGASLGLEEHHFDNARDAMVGHERAELPEDKQISRAEEDPEWDPIETARDDVEGIDFDNLEPPEEDPGEATEGEAGGGFHESMDRLVGEQAELEYNSQQMAERRNRGEAPMHACREGVERENYRDRPWKAEDEGPATGEGYVQRFIESKGDSVDTVQSPAVHQAIAERQPENEIDLSKSSGKSGEVGDHISERLGPEEKPSQGVDKAIMDAAESSLGRSPEHVAEQAGIGGQSQGDEYDNAFDAIVNGEKLVDDDVDPAPVLQKIGSVDESKVIGPASTTSDQLGETAIENLHDAGYVYVRDLQDATVDDLTQVNGVGEKKAERLIENEGKIARNLDQTAKRLEDKFSHKQFGEEEYRRILTHAAKKGLPVDVGQTIFNETAVQKEIPGPTPVSDLRAGEAEGRARANKARKRKRVETHETEENTSFKPSGERYNYQAPITVEGVVVDTYEPRNPENGEHQVAHIVDHEGNHTKVTIYRDSIKEWDDQERHNSGQFRDGETDPDTGIGPNTVLKSGDTIQIKNPQVNDYGGSSDESWDGPTLATTPDTTINSDAPPRRQSDGKTSAEMDSRGSATAEERRGAPDYVDGNSRSLRRRNREYEEEHGKQDDNRLAEEEDDDRNISDVDADI